MTETQFLIGQIKQDKQVAESTLQGCLKLFLPKSGIDTMFTKLTLIGQQLHCKLSCQAYLLPAF